MDDFDFPKVDRTAFTVSSLSEPSDEKAYWLSKTPQERLEAVELMRQVIYGYDPSTARLDRSFFEVVQRDKVYTNSAGQAPPYNLLISFVLLLNSLLGVGH